MENEIFANLEKMDPAKRTQMLAIMKEIGSPPESLFNMLERLGIPWEKRSVSGKPVIIIDWQQFMDGEQRNQAQGSILKRLMQTSVGQQVSTPAVVSDEVTFDDEVV